MKIKVIIIAVVLFLTAYFIFIACETKPTKPEYNNVFDPGNPTTSGDPFQLQVAIGNGGVTLTWTNPDIQKLHSFKIYRSEQEDIGYISISTITANNTEYVDQTVHNGHSYWYLIAAIDGKGNETGTTKIAAINIKTEPVLVINSGDEYTLTKEVNLTILANTAQQIMLSNFSDFSGTNWETYATYKNWFLLTGEGEKLVYMKVQYNDGTESPVVIDTISPQPMKPSISINNGDLYTPNINVDLQIAAIGATEMKISEDSTFTGINWQTLVNPNTVQLSDGDGKKKVFAIIKNDFDIESAVLKDIITLDTTPPIPVLTVSPDSGITNETTFQFDPTGSSDNLYPHDSLKIRYDWENDGIWDTNMQPLSMLNYKYILGGGNKTIKMQIQDGADWIADTTEQIFVNTRPLASFTTTQNNTNYLLFHFDASAAFDHEDGANLQYRWDLNGDGIWETGWLIQDTISFLYSSNGVYLTKLIVRDLNNLTASISDTMTVCDGTVTDVDGNTYLCAKIGNQWWMAENLKVTHYQNGDAIPNVTDNGTWTRLTKGAYCAYNNNNGHITTYGLLYNWYTIIDNRNISPLGWHVPSDDDWKQLEIYLGMSQSQANSQGWRGTDEGGKLKEAGTSHWNSPNTGATNSSGFTSLPGGWRLSSNGEFRRINYDGSWWSSTELLPITAWYRYLVYDKPTIFRGQIDKQLGYSIRCVIN